MSEPVRETHAMIAGMRPTLASGEFAFVPWPDDTPWPEGTRASYVEPEGLSLIVPIKAAPAGAVTMHCITLQVHSSLEGVGLTAAVSTALAKANIPANVVAAFHHDHVYVPAHQSEDAMTVLTRLQTEAS